METQCDALAKHTSIIRRRTRHLRPPCTLSCQPTRALPKPFSSFLPLPLTPYYPNPPRLQPWLLNQLNGNRKLPAGASEWQRGCPSLVPSLRSSPFWEGESLDRLPWVRALEEAAPVIRAELLALRGAGAFQPYRAPMTAAVAQQAADGIGSVSHDSGDWSVMYLFLHNLDFSANRDKCPETCKAIASIGSGHYHHAFFSALAPGTHITKHHGPTNKKLRCHLPLVVPPRQAARLRVGDEIRALEEGKCVVFDDSFEHEAWNDDPERTRLVLILDVWHPDLTPKEVKFLAYLQNAALKAEKELVTSRDSEAVENAVYDNFFSVITAARALHASDEKVFR